MFGPPKPRGHNHMRWNYHRPPHNLQWRHPIGPRMHFRGQHQLSMQHRPPFQCTNDNYWCETCDRGFPTEDILIKHKQQHQKCNIDGCQFVAHPKVITKHIQMQHSTGLYKKIANIKNPEEIEKWREERRKKYPTKTNIEKKAAELTEKIDRGEKMGLDGNRNRRYAHNSERNRENNNIGQGLKRRNNMQSENQPRTKFMRNNKTDINHIKPPLKTRIKTLPIVEESRKLQPFTGILNLLMDGNNEIEDTITETNIVIEDDDYHQQPKGQGETKSVDTTGPVVCGALSSLICDYASSDEDETNEVRKIITKDINQEPSKIMNVSQIDFELKCDKITDPDILKKSSLVGSKCEKEIRNECFDLGNIDDGNEDVITKNEIKKKKYDLEVKVKFQNVVEDNDSGPEEVKAVVRKHETLIPAESFKPKDVIKKKTLKDKKVTFQQAKRKLPSTLLQKLLFKEMQQERNIVLQCIRYIRNKNYFNNLENKKK